MKITRKRKLSRKTLYMSWLLSGLGADKLSQFIFAKSIEGPDSISKKSKRYINTLLNMMKKGKMKHIKIQSILLRKPNRFRFNVHNGQYYPIHRGPEDIADTLDRDVECSSSNYTLTDYICWNSYHF